MYAIKIDNISKTYRIYKKPFQRVIDLILNEKNYTEYKALQNIDVEIEKKGFIETQNKDNIFYNFR